MDKEKEEKIEKRVNNGELEIGRYKYLKSLKAVHLCALHLQLLWKWME